MLVIAQSRAMDLQHVLKFSIGPVPWSLATPDGQLRKTTKAVLLNLLEKGLQPLTAVPDNTVWILDVTALLQSMPCSQRTFGELAEAVCSNYIKFQQVWSANRFCRRPVPSCQYQGQ